MAHRFFIEGAVPAEGALPLAPSDVHHLRDVLRLTVGDVVVLAGSDGSWQVRLADIGDVVTGKREAAVPAPVVPPVTLVQGIAKGERMDMVMRQATEIGVARIVPLRAERSIVRLDAAKSASRTERWRRIAAEAAKQCQRADVPVVTEPVSVAALAPALSASAIIVCWEEAPDADGIAATLDALAVDAARDVAVVIGPEGGLTAAEVETLVASGARVASLGPTVLRTETAGVLAAALAIHERGGLGNRQSIRNG